MVTGVEEACAVLGVEEEAEAKTEESWEQGPDWHPSPQCPFVLPLEVVSATSARVDDVYGNSPPAELAAT